ncbi:MAG: hypothetical protein P1T08_18125 [Acidimicrobiia bacterium]|nr:hypothetical protein [Acidimicrobiia bacterium]
MATTPQAPGGTQPTDSMSEMVGNAAAEAGTEPVLPQTPSGIQREFRPERTEAFDTLVENLRKLWIVGPELVLRSLSDRIRRRLGLAPRTTGAAALYGLTGFGIRLAVVVLATALAGQWTGIPWGRWAAILVLYGLIDVILALLWPVFDDPVPPRLKPLLEDWTALIPTIARESDLRDLAGLTRRLYRLPVVATAGVAVAAVMLLASWLFAPTALGDLPAGSIVLLALLLYDFGTLPIWSNTLLNWVTMSRQARYDHQLFWPSPADSPEIRKAMRRTIWQAFTAGMWTTLFLVLTVVLVGWDSALVLPMAVGFVAIGYVSTFALAFRYAASVRKIVERSRNQRLQGLQRRIDAFGPRYTNLSTQESEELRDLLFLHDRIRDAPATVTTTNNLLRTAAGLLIPTIAFVVTVFGEVSAERLLDAILP